MAGAGRPRIPVVMPNMRWTAVIAAPVLALTGLAVIPNVAPPSARADCTSTGRTTICSQGESRGVDTGRGPSGAQAPWVPYPCEYDWYFCPNTYGWTMDLDYAGSADDFTPPGGVGWPGFGAGTGGGPGKGQR